MTFVILLIFILEKRYEIQMNDTETKNTAVKAPALMSTRPVTAQDALDQCEKLSPMMVHYCQTKTGLTDPANTILFYRLGDFYEMFFEDATLVSKELELTLTGKDCGMEDRAPMCGIPYHAAEGYINRLVENGHKVAICEQMEDPKQAKGMVKREVIRVAWPHFAPGIAADTAVATGEIAQRWRHAHQVVGEGDAGFATQQQAAVVARRHEPARVEVHLGEAGIRTRAFHAAA